MRVRTHVGLRWLSCPFDAILREIPMAATMLDYGCGHGLLALEAATRRGATVLGVDIDRAKIAIAQRVALANTSFAVIASNEPPSGTWDVICVTDVLYLMPRDDQRELVTELARRLDAHGVLVVKEMDVEPRWKAAWMRLQERVMVRVLGATKGDALAFTDPVELAAAMRGAGLDVETRRLDRWSPYPHVMLIGRAA